MKGGVLLKWLINSAVLFVLPYIIPGVSVSEFVPALAMALMLGIINTILKPILVILSLPISILTLGFFTFVINGFLFWLAAGMVSGYSVDRFLTALLAAFVFSIASMVLNKTV
jgi:putative membrane protein